jgi:hypothetical protein
MWFRRGAILLAAIGLPAVWGCFTMISMPGRSYRGPLPPLTAQQRAIRDGIRRDIDALAGAIGGRSAWSNPRGLVAAAELLERSLTEAGYEVKRQSFRAARSDCANLEVEFPGATRPGEVVVVGAHYDTCGDLPGADDNASGVAAALALARTLRSGPAPGRTLRFVIFVNEEPPFFRTEAMGSLVYARECRRRGDDVVAMLSLETVGYYTDVPGSQRYPWPLSWFYPSTGDFIGFIGDGSSRGLVRSAVGSFRRHASFPSEGAVLPRSIPGVGWSDHWAFWQCGYPAAMVTDTAPFRNPNYHAPGDTPETLDYDRMARVVDGLRGVVGDLISP